MPPWSEVEPVLWRLALPAFAAALAVIVLLRLVCGEKLMPLAAALALVVGLLTANLWSPRLPIPPEGEEPLWRKFLAALEPPSTEESISPPTPSSWLAWLAALALAVDLVARLVPSGAGWAGRTLVAVLAGRLLVRFALRSEAPWLPWAMAGAILLQWAILSELSRRWKDGTPALAASPCLAALGMVILHAHSASLAETALMPAFALAGVGVAAFFLKGDAGSAAALAAVWLPGLALVAQQDTFSEVPWMVFLIAGLSLLPLGLLLPFAKRLEGWKGAVLAVVLALSASGVAAGWAMVADPLEL